MKNWLSKFVICFFITVAQAEVLDNRIIDNKRISQSQAIDQLKLYLREIQSVAVDFTQEDSVGGKVNGKLLISKPYKFRCNYYPPFPLVIVGNKNYVAVYDYDMEHVSRIKATENIFYFLLDDTVNLEKYVNVESSIEQGNILKMTIYNNLLEHYSKISFYKDTKQIKMIKVFEDKKIITIIFNNIVTVQKFDADLFTLKNPDIFGIPSRFTKEDIEKKYSVIS